MTHTKNRTRTMLVQWAVTDVDALAETFGRLADAGVRDLPWHALDELRDYVDLLVQSTDVASNTRCR